MYTVPLSGFQLSVESNFTFALVLNYYVLWLVNKTPATFYQWESKQKPIVFLLHVFSRAWRQLHVFASDSDWLIVLFTSVAIGQSNYFGFGFTTHNWKPLYLFALLPRVSKALGFPVVLVLVTYETCLHHHIPCNISHDTCQSVVANLQ